MKFKTLNMQKDKILGASACSLLKTFWIFLHANVYVCLFPFLYTKLCPLKWKFSHSSQVLKMVKKIYRAGNTFLIIWTVLLHTLSISIWKLSKINKKSHFLICRLYFDKKKVWKSTSLALITLVLKWIKDMEFILS